MRGNKGVIHFMKGQTEHSALLKLFGKNSGIFRPKRWLNYDILVKKILLKYKHINMEKNKKINIRSQVQTPF